jgi:hypothetical protein
VRFSIWRPARGAWRPAPIRPERETITAYSEANQHRIRDACPHASEVRTFHGWLAIGRCVMKAQKGIRIVAPDEVDDGKVRSIKPVYLFNITQTQVLCARAAA